MHINIFITISLKDNFLNAKISCSYILLKFLSRRLLTLHNRMPVTVVPGAFNMTTGPAHWELLARGRAVDNQVYVASISPARDENASYVAWGHSTLVNPW